MFPSSLRQAWETNRCDYGPWRLARTLTVNKKNMSMDRASAAPRPSRPASVTAAAKLRQREIKGLQKPGWCELTLACQEFLLLFVVVSCLNILNKNTGKATVNSYSFFVLHTVFRFSFLHAKQDLRNEDGLEKAVMTKKPLK